MRHAARDAQLLMFSIGTSSSCLVMLCEMASLWYCYGSPSFTCSMLAAISASPLPSRAPRSPLRALAALPRILQLNSDTHFQYLGGWIRDGNSLRTASTSTTTATILAMALPAR